MSVVTALTAVISHELPDHVTQMRLDLEKARMQVERKSMEAEDFRAASEDPVHHCPWRARAKFLEKNLEFQRFARDVDEDTIRQLRQMLTDAQRARMD